MQDFYAHSNWIDLGMKTLIDRGPGKFDGVDVDMNCILVKHTWNGDMDVNGVVDADDYYQIGSGFLAFVRTGGKTFYRWGDLDFSDCVDADDFYLIDSAYLGQKGVVMSAPMAKAARP